MAQNARDQLAMFFTLTAPAACAPARRRARREQLELDLAPPPAASSTAIDASTFRLTLRWSVREYAYRQLPGHVDYIAHCWGGYYLILRTPAPGPKRRSHYAVWWHGRLCQPVLLEDCALSLAEAKRHAVRHQDTKR